MHAAKTKQYYIKEVSLALKAHLFGFFFWRGCLLVLCAHAFQSESASNYVIKLRFNFALRNALYYDTFLY